MSFGTININYFTISVKCVINDTILSFFIICLACVFSILFSVYYIGLTVSERIFLKKRISAFLLYHKDVWKSFDRKYGLKK